MRRFVAEVLLMMAAASWLAAARAQAHPPPALSGSSGAPTPGPAFGVQTLAGRSGAVGLPGMSTAQVGPPGGLRLGLGAELFHGSNFLISAPGSSGDRNTRLRGLASVAGTPWAGVELFAAVSGTANRNRRVCGRGEDRDRCVSESGRADPEVIRSSGALAGGVKLARTLPAGWAVGAELGARLWPSPGGLAFEGNATSLWLDALAGVDLRETLGWPLRGHLGAGFFLDNSFNLAAAETSPTSRLVSAFAHGLGRERLRTTLAVDSPWRERWGGRLLRPSLEYHLEVVTAGADPLFTSAPMDELPDNRDQHWVTLGLAVQGRRGWALTAAADLALRSTGFAHGPRLPTASFSLSFSQALDLSAPRQVVRIVERTVAAPPREGQLSGRVMSSDGRPLDGALVAIEGGPRTRVASEPDGTFRAPALPPGPRAVLVSAPGFEEARLPAMVEAGRDTSLTVTLERRRHALGGRLLDARGLAVRGTARLYAPGAALDEATPADDTGAFTLQVPPGRHRVRLDGEGVLSQLVAVEISQEGQVRAASPSSTDRVDPPLRPRPARPGFAFVEGRASFARAFPFVDEPRELSPGGRALLDELVDALLQAPGPARMRIEVHWDGGLGEEEAQRRSDERAAGLRRYFSDRGLEQEVEIVALGRSAPLPGQPRSRQRRLEARLLPWAAPAN